MVVAAHPATCACCRRDRAPKRFRRELTIAETHLDIHADTDALDATKDALEQEIRREALRAARRVKRGARPRVRLDITPKMVALLVKLRDQGRAAATREAASMGVELAARSFATSDAGGLDRSLGTLIGLLSNLGTRMSTNAFTVQGKGVGMGIDDVRDAMFRAIRDTPGARDAASRVVSMTFATGLDDVFSANEDAFGGWQYSAVMDGGTCDPCAEHDGEVYPTWDAIQEVLPNGGPNPECDGGNRCRCRPIGLPPDTDAIPAPAPPPPEPEPVELAPFAQRSDALAPRITHDPSSGLPIIPDAFKADHARIMETGKTLRTTIDERVNTLFDERLATRPASAGHAQREWDKLHGYGERPVGVSPFEWDRRAVVKNREIAAIEREVITEATNGEVTFGTDKLAFHASTSREGTVHTMAEKLPDSWLRRSNDAIHDLAIRDAAASQDTGRSYFTLGNGQVHSIVMSETSSADVFLHELVHRMEAVIPELRQAEATFFDWRARGGSWDAAREGVTEISAGEWGVGDKFLELYSGRDYQVDNLGNRFAPGGRHEAYELLTTALQYMHGKTSSEQALAIRGDREFRDWALGVLASLRP